MAPCAATSILRALAPRRRVSGLLASGIGLPALGFALILSHAQANPAGGVVTHGSATIDQNGNTLTINQRTDLLIMGWHSFSIGQGETTRFVQPGSSSMALNRVYGGTRSMIEGRLEANGGVILINPAGITVTKSGVVNVNTFIGSTHDITDDEFLKGGALNFKGTSDASIENLGTIHAETGDIALIARTVRNEGALSAPKGVVGLAAGDEVLYQPNAEERLLVKSQTASAASIHHSGSIQAAAAEIKAAGNPYAVAINLDGIVEARGNAAKNIRPRVIVHAAQGDLNVGSAATISAADDNGGLVKIQAATGNLQLDGKVAVGSSTGKGGEIRILGNTITVSGTALLDASGATGGGMIFIGGDYQGGANTTNNYASEPLQNASTLRIDKGAVMNADATVQGDGGVIINWADGNTISSGSVSVRGGPLAGNGGFVEISGKQNLGFDGAVDLAAPNGQAGQVLFDPSNLQIHHGSSKDDGLPAGVGLPSIDVRDQINSWYMLSDSVFGSITNGTITVKANNVSFEDRFGSNRAVITLNPGVNFVVQSLNDRIYMPEGSSITTSGSGYVTLDASANSLLDIRGSIITDAGNIVLLAQNNIILNGATVQSTSGSITVSSLAGKIDFFSTVSPATVPTSANGSSIRSGSGTVTISAPGQIYLGGSSIISGTGNINVTSTTNIIKLFSDYYFPDGTNGALIPATVQSAGGIITLNGATEVILEGATITNTSGAIQISSTNGGIVLDVAPYKKDTASVYGSAFSGTTIYSVTGPINLSSKNDVTLTEATLTSGSGAQITITSETGNIFWTNSSGIRLINAMITSSGGGDIRITSSGEGYPYIDIYNSLIETTGNGSVSLTASSTNTTNGYSYVQLGNSTITTASGNVVISSQNTSTNGYSSIDVYNSSIQSTNGGSITLTSSGGYSSYVNIYNSLIETTGQGAVNISANQPNTNTASYGYSYIWLGSSTITAEQGNISLQALNSGLGNAGVVTGSSTLTTTSGNISISAQNTDSRYWIYLWLDTSKVTSSAGGSIILSASGSTWVQYGLLNSQIQTTSGAINLIKQGGTSYASFPEILNNWYQTLFISGSSITSGSGAIALSSGNHILIDPVASTNGTYWVPTSTIASVISSRSGSVSMTAVATNGIYRGTNTIANSTLTPTPAPTVTPEPIITAATIVAEPTVQTAVQNLTIRNNTATTSSGGSFGSAGPGSEGSGSGGESASAGETASSGESSSSASGGETASSESSGESGSSSESSTASADSGSGSGATTAGSDSSSSSGGSTAASSSSGSSSGGSAQGASAQAAAVSRMNNPVAGASVGGAEFQRLNPFSDGAAMHEEVAAASPSAGGSTQPGTGRAAAVSVKSPELTELAPMNDLNVLFMMF